MENNQTHSMTYVSIRPMQPQDLAEIVRIQAQCYTEITPESAESLADKQRLGAETCWVACTGKQLLGYVLALPWHSHYLPPLNARLDERPHLCDCVYLHDLAIDPAAHALGLGTELIHHVFDSAAAQGWQKIILIAIQGSPSYWQRYGFKPITPPMIMQEKLTSYGASATYMQSTTVKS